jgi:hypothetical protein
MCTEVQVGLFVATSTVLSGALSGKTLLTRALELAPRALLAGGGPAGMSALSWSAVAPVYVKNCFVHAITHREAKFRLFTAINLNSSLSCKKSARTMTWQLALTL